MSGDGVVGATDDRIQALAQSIWQYHHMDHELSPADAILVLGSHDKAVAEAGAELYLAGWAPLLIFSGGLGSVTRHMWREPEADQFARIAVDLGVPRENILIENQSTNTGENIRFTKRLLAERDIHAQKFILVHKPYMERRSYATFRQHWPEKDVVVTSRQVSFGEYVSKYSDRSLTRDDVISIMVGDLQRIRLYPDRGFQIPQEIPGEIWAAFEELVAAGYNRHLVGG